MDPLDKRILQHLSAGISSYEDLARQCNVARNTVYRRMMALEKKGVTTKITRTSFDYNKLDIVPIALAMNLKQQNRQNVLAALKEYSRVKFLFETFGTHNIIVIAMCDRGKEGETINYVKAIGERFNVTQIDVSVGFNWKKMDFSPFSEENEVEDQPAVSQEENEEPRILVDV